MKLNPIDSPGNNETPSRAPHDRYLIIVAADRDKEIKCFDGQNEGNLAKETESDRRRQHFVDHSYHIRNCFNWFQF